MKTKLSPKLYGKWGRNITKSKFAKMRLAVDLFSLCGADLDMGKTIPDIKVTRFYDNPRRFVFDQEDDIIYVNQMHLFSKDFDYYLIFAICAFYIERYPHLIKGGTVTLVDIQSHLDLSASVAKEIMLLVGKNVTAILLTKILVKLILR